MLNFPNFQPDWLLSSCLGFDLNLSLGPYSNSRSSYQWCSMRKGVLRKFAKFIGKHLCQSLCFNKAAGLRPGNLFKKRLWHRCFLVNFAKFLRTHFLQNTSRQLLLQLVAYKKNVYVIWLSFCKCVQFLVHYKS